MSILGYRCWGIREKQYLKLHSIHLSTKKVIVSSFGRCGGNISLPFDKVILEQYTGLKDKNGKEIYEGDFVKIQRAGKRPKIYRIGWFGLRAGFIATRLGIKKEEYLMENFCEIMTGEVIGNVHAVPKDFSPGHLKRMGVSINKGGEK